ncbi:MAG: hypothetical protein WC905_02160 [Patescibacteria group bacterium]|jgi:hypothetical protein
MKKKNFEKQIKAEAFRLWLKFNHKKAKKIERLIYSLGLILGLCLLFWIRPVTWEGVNSLSILIKSIVGYSLLGIAIISLFGLFSTIGRDPISGNSPIAWLYRRHPLSFIHMVLSGLQKEYLKEAEKWNQAGDQWKLYCMLHGVAHFLVYDSNPKSYSQAEDPTQMEKQWQDLFKDIIDRIEEHLDIEDKYFENPTEITAQIRSVRKVAKSFLHNDSPESNEQREALLRELRQLRLKVGNMSWHFKLRLNFLQYSDKNGAVVKVW